MTPEFPRLGLEETLAEFSGLRSTHPRTTKKKISGRSKGTSTRKLVL